MICSICQEETDQPLHELSCGHKFHANCIIKWLRQPGANGSCPNCRHVEVETTQSLSRTTLLEPPASISTSATTTLALRSLLKRSKHTTAPPSLKRAASIFRKWKTQLQRVNKEHMQQRKTLHANNRLIQRHRKELLRRANNHINNALQHWMEKEGFHHIENNFDKSLIKLRRIKRNFKAASSRLLNFEAL